MYILHHRSSYAAPSQLPYHKGYDKSQSSFGQCAHVREDLRGLRYKSIILEQQVFWIPFLRMLIQSYLRLSPHNLYQRAEYIFIHCQASITLWHALISYFPCLVFLHNRAFWKRAIHFLGWSPSCQSVWNESYQCALSTSPWYNHNILLSFCFRLNPLFLFFSPRAPGTSRPIGRVYSYLQPRSQNQSLIISGHFWLFLRCEQARSSCHHLVL